jgi:hypothetical protein
LSPEPATTTEAAFVYAAGVAQGIAIAAFGTGPLLDAGNGLTTI